MMVRETTFDEIFDAQYYFRELMDSMARPGKINRFTGTTLNVPEQLNTASAVVGLCLLNNDVHFFVSRNSTSITQYFTVNTASGNSSLSTADFVFISGNDDYHLLEDVQTGTLSYPETGAFIIIDVEAISEKNLPNALALTLSGPGVDGSKTIYIQGIKPEILADIKSKNSEYPLGVDTIITDQFNQIVCLPRSNHFSY